MPMQQVPVLGVLDLERSIGHHTALTLHQRFFQLTVLRNTASIRHISIEGPPELPRWSSSGEAVHPMGRGDVPQKVDVS